MTPGRPEKGSAAWRAVSYPSSLELTCGTVPLDGGNRGLVA
jgi:hypothetical protein